MALGWHIIIRFVDDRVIAPGPLEARRMIRSAARILGDHDLFALSVCGGHGHIGLLCDRQLAGELARRLEIGLWQVLGRGPRWESARIRPIHDQAHARNLFWYALGQPAHHEIEPVPFFEATNLPDLLGARVTLAGSLRAVRRHLPSVGQAALLARAALPPRDAPVALRPDLLHDAAAAAVALPRLSSRSTLAQQARAAAVQLASPLMPSARLATVLDTLPRTIRRDRARAVPERIRRAVALQWRWRSYALAGATGPPGTGSDLLVG